MITLPPDLADNLAQFFAGQGRIVLLTGAGISAESGIPTFRGKEGYWVVGSREYQPQAMATHAMFLQAPEAVWCWYLYRREICCRAEPNSGHRALVAMEQQLEDRFLLVTQNVDGLHLRAGNSTARTYQIHGNIDFARCDAGCGEPIWRLPEWLGWEKDRGEPLTDRQRAELHCPRCGRWARPHVLWFDECYDEEHFRYESSIRAASEADLLLVVGTSGATHLPMQIGYRALSRGAMIVDINVAPNPFSRLAEESGGVFLQRPSSLVLPQIAQVFSRFG